MRDKIKCESVIINWMKSFRCYFMLKSTIQIACSRRSEGRSSKPRSFFLVFSVFFFASSPRPLPRTISTPINFYFTLSGHVAFAKNVEDKPGNFKHKCWALNLSLNICFLILVAFQINLIICFQMKTMFPSFMAWVFLAHGIHNTFSGELVKVIW